MKTEQISQNQLLLFFILYFFSTLVGFGASHLIYLSQYDSLIVLCLSALTGIILAFFVIKLAKRRPNEFIVHYGKEIFPNWIHISFMAIFFFSLLNSSALILREYEDFIVQIYLPKTPNWAVGCMFGVVVAVTARLGFENLFRIAQGLFYLVIIANIGNMLFIGKELRWERWIAFITNHSGQGIFMGSYSTAHFFGEAFILLFLFPYLTQKHKTFKSIIWASFFSILFISSNIIWLLLLFGPNLASHLTYPMLEMIRYIRIADFIQNLDHLLISIWATTVFIKVTVLFTISVQILAQLFRLKDHRPLVFSLTAVMIVLSINISSGFAEMTSLFTQSFATFSYSLEFIPLLYLIMDTVKRSLKKKADKKLNAS
ncbi:GerAB/ArcD/ProY family transporter [Neobacillus cucumis]|uniref:GerAB/ArcD/ProY family transporter n=1 Tax=Neobacillus cucumis TaxID=1740721 RepID=UPI0018DEF34D|nr:GerAB/ArcD/ProY family transporter [Neobacillus cucumis]MBI0580922.1 GerAB/ArcD/ProY family transporter [Neobacillus cucumis]